MSDMNEADEFGYDKSKSAVSEFKKIASVRGKLSKWKAGWGVSLKGNDANRQYLSKILRRKMGYTRSKNEPNRIFLKDGAPPVEFSSDFAGNLLVVFGKAEYHGESENTPKDVMTETKKFLNIQRELNEYYYYAEMKFPSSSHAKKYAKELKDNKINDVEVIGNGKIVGFSTNSKSEAKWANEVKDDYNGDVDHEEVER